MSTDKRARLKQWLESGQARLQPLTLPQRELWEAAPAPPGDVSNHICCLVPVRGMITRDDALTAVERVVERQEALRLSILPGKDRPLQMIRSSAEANVEFRELPEAQRSDEGVEEVAREIFRAPLDLTLGPLYRVGILRRAIDDHVLVLAIHHAIADGWSLGVFVEDVCGAYLQGVMGTKGPLPPVAQTYSDWGAADRAQWGAAQIDQRSEFWKSKLAGTRRLWTTREKPSTAPALPDRWVTMMPADLGRAARDLARRSSTTLFSTLLSAFQIAVARWSGSNDIVVGSPVANRSRQAVRETVGSFAGIVPLRGQVDLDRTFSDAQQDVHHNTVESFAEAIPFVELVRIVNDPAAPGYNPIFEIRFALQNHPMPEVALPGLSAHLEMRSTGTPRFEIACELTEQGDPIEIAWLYRPSRFPAAEIEKLNQLFQAVLAAACRDPESHIRALLP